MRAVRYDRYGDESVLEVRDVPNPRAGDGDVVVRVVVAGTNPGESAIRQGVFAATWPSAFPEGQGSDLAGVVVEVGAGVTDLAPGDAVIGLSDSRNAQAELAVLPEGRVLPKPDGLGWDAAGSLYIAGTTALAVLQTRPVGEGDTVAIAGAAGGVGVILTQLAVRAGARVVAIASEPNHAFLAARGAEPVAYGDGLEQRLRDTVPEGLTAFFDCFGGGYTDLAVTLGVPPDRVVTIIDFAAPGRLGVQAVGMAALDDPREGVRDLAAIAAEGGLVLPVKARFPLSQVREAYRVLSARSGLGMIVLDVSAP